jgi:ribosomal protein L32
MKRLTPIQSAAPSATCAPTASDIKQWQPDNIVSMNLTKARRPPTCRLSFYAKTIAGLMFCRTCAYGVTAHGVTLILAQRSRQTFSVGELRVTQMADIGSIAAAIGGLKAAADIAKGFLDLKEIASVQGKVIELQGVILSAQSSALAAQSDQLSLLEDIRGLKAKMAELEAWNTEKQRYKLERLPPGFFVYSLKKEMAQGEPTHRLCAKCFQHDKKAILQEYHAGLFRCLECKSDITPDSVDHYSTSSYTSVDDDE